ncbi:hypothetical protein [Methanooceanicella nereidis]|nr:hypothetical protein [Methanocella sp. CWC-04]
MVKRIEIILTVIVLAAILSVSGCAGEKKLGEVLYGKDVFEPSGFSMARYTLTVNESGDITQKPLMVLTGMHETDGDRLSTIELIENGSSRTDIWLNKPRTMTNKMVISDVRKNLMKIDEISVPFNLTVMDTAWNTLEAEYRFIQNVDVTTPAGSFKDCSMYGASKTMRYGDKEYTVNVFYIMHPSCPVPVKYEVDSAQGSEVYELQSVYGPDDINSSPERAVQSYFDDLDAGDFKKAADLVVMSDSGGKYVPLDKAGRDQLSMNMANTYGEKGEKMHVQYVYVDEVTMSDISGTTIATVHWSSSQYERYPIKVYNIEGYFKLALLDDRWYIIA